jgi:hypothetical protein
MKEKNYYGESIYSKYFNAKKELERIETILNNKTNQETLKPVNLKKEGIRNDERYIMNLNGLIIFCLIAMIFLLLTMLQLNLDIKIIGLGFGFVTFSLVFLIIFNMLKKDLER